MFRFILETFKLQRLVEGFPTPEVPGSPETTGLGEESGEGERLAYVMNSKEHSETQKRRSQG